MGKLVVLNHKSVMDYDQIKQYIKDIKDNIRTDLEVIVAPSMCYLPFFSGKYDFKLASQNVGFCNGTGEVLARDLKSLGVSYAIIGHSERREVFFEDDKMINMKIRCCLNENIHPIVCVGETYIERETRKTQEVLTKQLKYALRDVLVEEDIIIAYEPVWAVGTDKIPSVSEIKEVVSLIKNLIFRMYGKNIKVLYGGSVNKDNIKVFDNIKELDGFLIGRSSVLASDVLEIMNKID